MNSLLAWLITFKYLDIWFVGLPYTLPPGVDITRTNITGAWPRGVARGTSIAARELGHLTGPEGTPEQAPQKRPERSMGVEVGWGGLLRSPPAPSAEPITAPLAKLKWPGLAWDQVREHQRAKPIPGVILKPDLFWRASPPSQAPRSRPRAWC